MTETTSAALLSAARRLDETPMTMLNGGASDAISLLNAVASEVPSVARARDIDPAVMSDLWSRAQARLSDVPDADSVFQAAAEAASLLYVAAWAFGSDSATTAEIQDAL